MWVRRTAWVLQGPSVAASLPPYQDVPPPALAAGLLEAPPIAAFRLFCTVTTARLRPLEDTRGLEKEEVAQGSRASCSASASTPGWRVEKVPEGPRRVP